MKFRFCGEADCPDWLLAQINTLSRMSSIKLKQLTQLVAQGIMEPPIDMSKAEKLFSDSKLDSDLDLKTCIACLSFLLTSTIQYNCNSTALHSELQQLGLPREHSTSIKRIVDEQNGKLTEYFRNRCFKVNHLENVSVNFDIDSNLIGLKLTVNGVEENVALVPSLVDSLLNDLKLAYSKMLQLNDNPMVFT